MIDFTIEIYTGADGIIRAAAATHAGEPLVIGIGSTLREALDDMRADLRGKGIK